MKTDKLSNLLGLYLLVAIVAGVILGLFVIKPIYAKAAATRGQAKEMRAKIAALEQLGRDTETLRGNYEEVKEERDRILALLPVSTEEERLLAYLSELAQQSGAVLSTFAPTAASVEAQSLTSISVYPVSINVSGSYQAIYNFLEKVEEGARFVDVHSGSFASAESAGVAVKVDLTAYYQQAPAEEAAE